MIRRLRSLLVAALVVVAIVVGLRAVDLGLGRAQYASGYLLYGLVAFLTLFSLRKKLPTLPLGSASSWLQIHLYGGVVAGLLFGIHLDWQLPTGIVETALGFAFMMTFVSGLVGLVMTRRIPKVLSRVGEEVVYERIPQLRRRLHQTSRTVVLDSVAASGSTLLAQFYSHRLFDFFATRPSWAYLIRPSGVRRRRVMHEMRDLERYLTPEEKSGYERLFGMVRQKDDLDFQEARQRLLKLWMFGHIGMTGLLVTLATLHGILALAFRGDAL